MTSNLETMSCVEFQAGLPDLIGSGQDAGTHPHLQSCELCRALLADLETIAQAARQLFPGVEPRDEVWENIESAIRKENQKKDDQAGGAAEPRP